MSDEDHTNDRTREADPGHDHPEEQSSERQQRGHTPVRLAGFPAPPLEPPAAQKPPPEEDSSEEESTRHTGDDISNEPADDSAEEVSEGCSEEAATGQPDDEQQAHADGESSESRHVPVHGQQHANDGTPTPGGRLVVPASRPPDGAGAPQQHKPAPGQPAAEDESGVTANAPAQDDLRRDEGNSEEQTHTTSEPADTANGQDLTGPTSQADRSISANNSPAAADAATQSAASETPNARNRAAQRRSRANAGHQQTVADPAVGPDLSEDPPGRGPVAPTSGGGGGESYGAGEPRSETEPSRRKRTSTVRGRFKIPWRRLALAAAVIVVVGAGAAGAFALWPESGTRDSSGAEQAGAQSSPGSGGGVPQAGSSAGGEGSSAVRETGVAFEELSAAPDNGGSGSDEGGQNPVDVSLTASVEGGEELNWTGTAQGAVEGGPSLQDSPHTARSISLSGGGSPTSANFQSGFEMPTGPGSSADGEVQSGVMARTEPGEPVRHATYQRLAPAGGDGEGGGQSVHAQGSYYIADDEGVIAEGSYTDRRQNDSQRVVRTYSEDNPATGGQRSFRVAFEAPAGTPVPTLVGWQPPEEGGG